MIDEIHHVRYKKGIIELVCYGSIEKPKCFTVKLKATRKTDEQKMGNLSDVLSDLIDNNY